GTEFLGQSDRQGRFTLGGLPLGLQIVRVRKVGYRVQYFAIRLAGGQDWEGRVTLPKLPQTLGEIVVVGKWGKPPQYANTAKYDDFYRRRASRSGKYLTREEIDKTAAGRISELLRAIPGVRVGFVQPGESENVSFLTCPAYNVSVWIDGQKVTGQVGEILPLIAPSDIEAMEVYQRQALVPPEFRDNSCAAIVLWTR
ncbi:MAG: TonB-dependent receptor plug domain-containing protein, partial [Gemmatimonadales bacterium]|nr:TonB-dependent receptor plug domain-containing protein [Gemmatimonadales bacterium]